MARRLRSSDERTAGTERLRKERGKERNGWETEGRNRRKQQRQAARKEEGRDGRYEGIRKE